MLRFGTRVEVHEIVAGAQAPHRPMCGWIGGYRFSRYGRNDTVLLWKRCFGRWMKVRFPLRDIRIAKAPFKQFQSCPASI